MASLSIKNVPEELISRLKTQAKQNHRSLQGEIMAILEASAKPRRLKIHEVHDLVKEMGLKTGDDSTRWIRELRDAR